MGWHCHHCTRAVFHQYEVGHINGHTLFRHGIATIGSGEHPFLFKEFRGPFAALDTFSPLNEFLDGGLLWLPLTEFQGQWVLHCKAHEGCTVNGVLTCGKDLDVRL